MFTRFLILILISLNFVGCNYTKFKESSEIDESRFVLPKEKLGELSYGLIAQKVFTPKCTSCHGDSGRVSLESYGDVLKNLDGIRRSVFQEKTMPKRGPLSTEELAYLWNWIKLGAPENSQSGKPPPLEEPILPTFESIDKRIFQVTCKDCHNPQDSGKRVPLDKESILNSPLELVIPGNPDESGLTLAVERTDDKRMPPAKEGYSALSAEAIEAIRQWIQNGATD